MNALQLEVPPASIDPGMRLFGEGLGLDSTDALELALAITRAYGFELRSDDGRNQQIFASLRSLGRILGRTGPGEHGARAARAEAAGRPAAGCGPMPAAHAPSRARG